MDNSTGSEQGIPIFYAPVVVQYHLYTSCYVCALGFLTTLLLSLPQLAAPQRTTVSIGTQADAPVKGSTERKRFYLTK